MNYVKFKRIEGTFFFPTYNSEYFLILARFLAFDINDAALSLLAQLSNNKNNEPLVFLNHTLIFQNDIVKITEISSDKKKARVFAIVLDQLVYVLTAWHDFLKRRIGVFIVYESAGKFYLESQEGFTRNVRTLREINFMHATDQGEIPSIEKAILTLSYPGSYETDGTSESMYLFAQTIETLSYVQQINAWHAKKYQPNPLFLPRSSIWYRDDRIRIEDELPYSRLHDQHPLETFKAPAHVFFKTMKNVEKWYLECMDVTITKSWE